MATYRPIKKIAVPLIGALLGLICGWLLLQTRQTYTYRELAGLLETWRHQSYEVDSFYELDHKIASQSTGYWSPERSYYENSSAVTDGTDFRFSIHLIQDRFYIQYRDDWIQGSLPHRFVQEIAPLDDPFEWFSQLLKEADQATRRSQGNREQYTVTFEALEQFDVRGFLLEQQQTAHLTFTLHHSRLESAVLDVHPLRPEGLLPTDYFPKNIKISIAFAQSEEIPWPMLPDAALTARTIT